MFYYVVSRHKFNKLKMNESAVLK